MAKKKRERRPAIFAQLDPAEEKALDQWMATHAGDRIAAYKIGAFAFMSMPYAERVAWGKRYAEWREKGYPFATLEGGAR